MMTQTRPDTVPTAAWFDDSENEWVFGPKDEDGRLHGEIHYWHPEGTPCCVCPHVHDTPHGAATRHHPNGEVSQHLTFVQGQLHGLRSWYSIDGPSPEHTRPSGVSELVMRSEMDYDMGTVTAVRHFDGDGHRLNADGTRLPDRPDHLPADAWWDERDTHWKHGRAIEQEVPVGAWQVWRADGTLRSDRQYADDGSELALAEHHPDGTAATSYDYVEEVGWARPCAGETDVSLPDMPEEASEIRFGVKHVRKGLHWTFDHAYFDADGQETTSKGRPFRRPHPDAWLVQYGSWNAAYYWSHTGEPDEHGRVTTGFWAQDGTPHLSATHVGDQLVGFVEYDDEGSELVRETFHPGRIVDDRPVLARLTATTARGKVDVTFDDDGRFVRAEHFGGDQPNRVEGQPAGLTPETFEAAFEERFGALLELGRIEVFHSFFSLAYHDVERYDDHFVVWSLAGDGGGNTVLVVGEGAHEGEVYFNDHEEMYCLEEESVEEALEEADVDPSEASADEMVEALPFHEYPLADSLDAFFSEIRVASHTTFWRNLPDYTRVEG